MNCITIKAFAKLNLTLNVSPLEASAKLHDISSVMVSVNIYDKVIVNKRSDKQVFVTMPGRKALENNSAEKAARLVCEAFGVDGADITIYKHIPYGGGLGGSSADAAAVLAAFSLLHEIPLSDLIEKCALKLGSDVAFMAKGGFGLVEGKGEKILRTAIPKQLNFTVINTGFKMSTAKVYAMFDKIGGRGFSCNQELMEAAQKGETERFTELMSNQLADAVYALQPKLDLLKDRIQKLTNEKVFLTGSGSCLYILCPSEEKSKRLAAFLKEHKINAVGCTSVTEGILTI